MNTIDQKSKTELISIHRINFEDATYSFRLKNPSAVEQLKNEMERTGQTHPVTLEKHGENEYRIIDGWMRCKALLKRQQETDEKTTVQAYVRPSSDLNEETRLDIIHHNNYLGQNPFGFYEKARFLKCFFDKGLPIPRLADKLNLHPHEVEDLVYLTDIPMSLRDPLNQIQAEARYITVLFHRHASWKNTPFKKEAETIARHLLTLFEKETITMKTWRFHLDFYWNGDRPSSLVRLL